MAWLLREGDVLASAEVASSRRARRQGLLGRDQFDGALVLRPCRQVHTFGMQIPIDIIWCDADGKVLRIASLRPGRVSRPVVRAKFVIEVAEGATSRWGIQVGDDLEVRVDGAGES